MKPNRKISFVAGVVVVCGIAVWMIFFQPAVMNRSSKEALVRMHGEISPGDSERVVEEVYKKHRTERTSLRNDGLPRSWSVGMPFEIGGTDRVLHVQFDMEKEVTAVAIRGAGRLLSRPADAPEDKGVLVMRDGAGGGD